MSELRHMVPESCEKCSAPISLALREYTFLFYNIYAHFSKFLYNPINILNLIIIQLK